MKIIHHYLPYNIHSHTGRKLHMPSLLFFLERTHSLHWVSGQVFQLRHSHDHLKNTSRKKTTILIPSFKKQYDCFLFFFFLTFRISNIRHKRQKNCFPFFGMSFFMIYIQFHKTLLPRISLSRKSLLTGHYSQTKREPCKGGKVLYMLLLLIYTTPIYHCLFSVLRSWLMFSWIPSSSTPVQIIPPVLLLSNILRACYILSCDLYFQNKSHSHFFN